MCVEPMFLRRYQHNPHCGCAGGAAASSAHWCQQSVVSSAGLCFQLDLSHSAMVVQVALLRALALVVAELEGVPDAALAACLAVARRLAGVYAGLYAGQRTAAHAAMAALLHVLAPRPALLAAAAPQLVAAVLEATLRPADAAGTC